MALVENLMFSGVESLLFDNIERTFLVYATEL